jgi:hypothetical protein
MQEVLKKQQQFLLQVHSSVKEDGSPDNIIQNIHLVQTALVEETGYDFLELKQVLTSLVHKLRGRIIRQVKDCPANMVPLFKLISKPPIEAIAGHNDFVKKVFPGVNA